MKTKHVVIGMMAAAAVGAVCGLLFAPDKGKETRKKIRDGANDLAGKVKKSIRKNHLTGEIEVS
ncbi:YtxH domain-containing protein [Pseudobacter ginsenosidimutans]|jgi:gas vesicle protein|uniref:YtxH-like protein n=1 Tax=Pseudobacter ginsenosidimutans TaxID=661488 RepID=A0A4Q7MV40_9BACT|nr:YtxH domain-containing protein [Pseudobacter ginsenosidimutans]QEC41367.1 YtxH domain-containing protein [Pseudobacter ginsenosidimutans]RZS71859.1 YtxH-like protein [Pseudobacter ginsenosidimutans]